MQFKLFLAGVLATLLLLQDTSAQIPTVCSDVDSLENTICCPTTPDGESVERMPIAVSVAL